MGAVTEQIRDKLTRAFAPERLEVIDDSARHAGHEGAAGGRGETHFDVEIVSAVFTGQSRVARQRAVNAALAEELSGPVHALSIRARAPGEGQTRR
jgi:BolA protein